MFNYPKLPDRSQHERDPWYSWDHPDLRRNWGEPIHWDFDMYIRNRVDTSPNAHKSLEYVFKLIMTDLK
uniref:Uncharacterized protein n=1 Tax=Esox lucius TaxID=8010 RepID=A0AAY5KNA4_ESOLU